MDEIKKQVENIEKESFVISGKVFKLFKDYLRKNMLSKQKIKILEMLDLKEYTSLEGVADYLKISLPLLSYHINGNLNSEGLIQAEMIDKINLPHGRVGIRINSFGNLILKTCK